jgi:hypothetical protein
MVGRTENHCSMSRLPSIKCRVKAATEGRGPMVKERTKSSKQHIVVSVVNKQNLVFMFFKKRV